MRSCTLVRKEQSLTHLFSELILVRIKLKYSCVVWCETHLYTSPRCRDVGFNGGGVVSTCKCLFGGLSSWYDWDGQKFFINTLVEIQDDQDLQRLAEGERKLITVRVISLTLQNGHCYSQY